MKIELDTDLTGLSCPDPLRHAFAAKKSAHARGGNSKPFSPEQAQSTWNTILASELTKEEQEKKRLAYFHIPFCRTHCSYCGFFQNTSKEAEIEKFVSHLEKEIEQTGKGEWVQSKPLNAVYFGGGTPTDLSADQIRRLGQAIRTHLPLADDVEMTFETRFNGLDDEKIAACREAGFNRFSLGLQTFDTFIRRKMSRIDPQDFLQERLEHLSQQDNTSTVVDLIYGLPWQTEEHWMTDLDLINQSNIHGVDLYQLIMMGGTRMAQSVAKGSMPAPGDTAFKAGLFKMGVETMIANGWDRLSVSHWGRPDADGVARERNIYNHFTKAGTEMIPFGCGAGGKVDGHSIMLHRSLEPYYAMVNAGQKPIMAMMTADPNRAVSNVLGGGFDLGTLNLAALDEAAGESLSAHCRPLFEAWQDNGLATLNNNTLDLTLAGQFWNVTMNQALNNYLERYPFLNKNAA
ncbi:heme anaerobic degradation radical SAM methyltransferase ChuW/HutW [Sansalvadorimonas verongulae]|uniref:heme anaerobic degradation radical SAM methyltransferase ChuW/HutW n=1 Tax=Sansalvadorimonas verongulae TaxID=2172824 RepID=UPI0012BCA739|nr:heme anaerobic degradation radical SAM methyltransferase ChuW/HutW [Sansalvadorimonas verongulae]MTI12847.1 heme anaerobic degradation radical SAM methyltransferase ChuW/HutW [Sansalvadorimonas verongulae]